MHYLVLIWEQLAAMLPLSLLQVVCMQRAGCACAMLLPAVSCLW